MVQIGTIEYEAKVSNVADAKANAQDFADTQSDVAESSEESAAATGFLAAKMGGLRDTQKDTRDETEDFDITSKLLGSTLAWVAGSVGGLATKMLGLQGAVGLARTGISWLAGLLPSLTLSGVMGSVTSALSGFVSWLAAGSAGALAVGAAIGAAIGVFGVWILKITGVLDKIGQLGAWLRDRLPGWARDGILTIIGLFTGPFAALGGFIIGTLEGGFDEGFARAEQILNIFAGSFRRTWNRIAGFFEGIWDGMTGTVRSFASDAQSFLSGIGEGVTTSIRSGFNAAVPNSVDLPSTTLEAPDWAGGYSYTIGGQSLDLPQLASGGMIQEPGVAQVHKGEAVIPEPLVSAAQSGGSGGGSNVTKVDQVVVNLDGDFDPSDMTRRELEGLADRLVKMIGKKTNSKAGVR